MNPYTWLAKKTSSLVATLILAGLAIALVVGGYFAVKAFFQGGLKTQVTLGKNQGQAISASGHDAVDTLGNTMADEQAADLVTKENDDAIRNAEGANAPVAAPVRDAGLASLCRRAAYRGSARCVQQPASK